VVGEIKVSVVTRLGTNRATVIWMECMENSQEIESLYCLYGEGEQLTRFAFKKTTNKIEYVGQSFTWT